MSNKTSNKDIKSSKTIICKKVLERKLYDVTRDPEDWIAEIKLLRGRVPKLSVNIDDGDMMEHILSNLSEKYKNIFENL